MSIFEQGLTKKLLEKLSNLQEIDFVLDQTDTDNTLAKYINIILEYKNIKKSIAIQKADIERSYGYEILRGEKKPSRDIALRILIACEVCFEDIQHVLKNAGYPVLYAKNTRDAIIIFCIQKKCDVITVNETLYKYKFQIL